jgi:tRNA dimethylallyltransferase
MIYRGMDIGTAKPTTAECAAVPHHLINVCEPCDVYSVGKFVRDVEQTIRDIQSRQRTPLLVGGTNMYFNALQRGLSNIPDVPRDVRETVRSEVMSIGVKKAHQQLRRVDLVWAERIAENDTQRVTRGLEVHRATGRPLTEWQSQGRAQLPFRWVNCALLPSSRQRLHHQIEQRFQAMLAQGLVAEVVRIRDRYGLSSEHPSMRSVGYRQVMHFLDGKVDAAEMQVQAIAATRQLAKRQLTWIRGIEQKLVFCAESATLNDEVLGVLQL